MPTNLEQVFKDVSQLTTQEKAWVAHCLIADLDAGQDEGIDAAWAKLAERRFTELVNGDVKAVSWEEIKQALKN